MNRLSVHVVTVPGTKHHKLILMHQIEIEPGTFIQHIRVETRRAQLADAGIKILPLCSEKFKL